jgi:predicted  nucleic acid-binding Zn-ribbon protein
MADVLQQIEDLVSLAIAQRTELKRDLGSRNSLLDKYNEDNEKLNRDLAEANDRYVLLTDELWHIFGEQDRRDYAAQAKEIITELAEAQTNYERNERERHEQANEILNLHRQLAEARKAAEWTPITPENQPNETSEVGAWIRDIFATARVDKYGENGLDRAGRTYQQWIDAGWTHFRPINPPASEEQPCGSAS